MRKVGIGIIGVGRIGKLHAENMVKNESVQLIGISDAYMNEELTEWSKPFNLAIITNNYLELIEDDRIDAVFICSPTNTHIELIKATVARGKHIFCEKPISFNYKETQEIMELVAQAGVVFQVGFNRRFDHNFRKVRELMAEDAIGEPHIIKITSRDPEPPPASYIRASGGLFMDMSIHDFDMARYISGSEVETVYAEGAVLVDQAIGELGDIDTAIITLRFANGALGVIDNSRKAVYGYDQRVEVLGSKGNISIENDVPTTVKISTKAAIVSDHPKYFFLDRYIESYETEVNHFVDSIFKNLPPLVSAQDGYEAERIAYAAKQSLLLGRVVRLEEIE